MNIIYLNVESHIYTSTHTHKYIHTYFKINFKKRNKKTANVLETEKSRIGQNKKQKKRKKKRITYRQTPHIHS